MIFDNKNCLYAHIRAAYRIGAEEIVNDNQTLILYLKDANMCIYENLNNNIDILNKFIKEKNVIRVETINHKIFDLLNNEKIFKFNQICVQGAKKKKRISANFEMQKPVGDDIIWICNNYDLTEEHIKSAIEKNLIYILKKDKEKIGFGGIHVDGSIGYIYVDPQYRRKGYAQIISKNIESLINADEVFVQIEKDNIASIEMHKKMGYDISKEYIYWIFDEAF